MVQTEIPDRAAYEDSVLHLSAEEGEAQILEAVRRIEDQVKIARGNPAQLHVLYQTLRTFRTYDETVNEHLAWRITPNTWSHTQPEPFLRHLH